MAGLMHDALLVAGSTAFCVTFGLLFGLYRRLREASRPAPPNNSLQNMTELSILFQTMRGLVREQKTLARDFNRSLDAKVQIVREAVKQVLAAYEQLAQMQKTFKAQFDQTPQNSPDGTAGGSEADPEEDIPVLRAIATPEVAGIIDNWRSHDAEPEADEDTAAEVSADEAPSNPVEAREARDALLNMGEPPEPAPEPAVPQLAQAAVSAEPVPAAPTNGGAAALRSRVFKYHDAGMNISEIAHELGLGKGEIRLMLSLREK